MADFEVKARPIDVPGPLVKTWSTVPRDVVFARTGVSVSYRERKKGEGKKLLTSAAPHDQVKAAVKLAIDFLHGEIELKFDTEEEARRAREAHEQAATRNLQQYSAALFKVALLL